MLRVYSRKHSISLRSMPQDWEPKDWAEAHAARVAREVARLRDPKSAQWLSDRTAELGYRVSRSVITDLENGRRKYVAAHELVMLAKALNVAPLQLLYGNDDGMKIEYLPGEKVARLLAVQNFSGISEEVLKQYENSMESVLRATETVREAVKALVHLKTKDPDRSAQDGG